MIISTDITVAINFNFCCRNQGLLKITVAKLAVELVVSSTDAVAEVCHKPECSRYSSQSHSVNKIQEVCCCLLRMRGRAKMIVKVGVCTTGCDKQELCV